MDENTLGELRPALTQTCPFSAGLSKCYRGGYGMNRTFKAAAAALIFAVSFAGSVSAGPLEDGTDAYWWKHDYATALRLLRPLAEKGDSEAQRILGHMYRWGQGVPRNDRGSDRLFEIRRTVAGLHGIQCRALCA
jgi:hypothetical protein